MGRRVSMEKKEYYQGRVGVVQEEIDRLQTRVRFHSMARVVAFLLSVVSALYGFNTGSTLLAIVAMALLILFFVFVRTHLLVDRQVVFNMGLLALLEKEMQWQDGDLSSFDPGRRISVDKDEYASDLDLYGEGSLFQYINRTFSSFGRDRLGHSLEHPTTDVERIVERQSGVKELAGLSNWREVFASSGSTFKGSYAEKDEIETWLKEDSKVYDTVFFKTMLKVLPLISVAMLVLSVIGRLPVEWLLTWLLFPNLVVISRIKSMNKEHRKLALYKPMMQKYNDIVKLIEQQEFQSEHLRRERESLMNMGASSAFKSITRIANSLDNRLNFVGAAILNGMLLWDIRYGLQLQKWKEEHRNSLIKWIDTISFFEVEVSYGFLHFNRPDLNFPEPTSSKSSLVKSEGMGHVLIDKAERVDNDFELGGDQRFVILTGANMAGKSTFLRALGTNMILGANGCPVCAETFQWRPLPLLSSMRTHDSLHAHESYFYAELKRLKEILTQAEKQEVFILLDEILKGTNSEDKAKGSYLFVENLLSTESKGIIATHDLSLCKLEDEHSPRIVNYHFDAEIVDDELSFDYTLKPGICENMNATFLLKKMGLT